MGNVVEELLKLRKEVVDVEKKVVGEKIQTAYEETRKNAEKVFEICIAALSEKAKDPYSFFIRENFECDNSRTHMNEEYLHDHLSLLPNKDNICSFGYVFESDEAKKSKLPKIYFDINYFKELISKEELIFSWASTYVFTIKVSGVCRVVDERTLRTLGLIK